METKHKKDKRKVLLVLPLLVLPFLALAFYAGGGGKGTPVHAQQDVPKGINTNLPDAAMGKNELQSKYDVYKQSDRDSSNQRNSIRDVADRLGFNGQQEDPQTQEINRKLETLNREITRPTESSPPTTVKTYDPHQSGMKNDVDRLEALMKTMKEDKGEDPEMEQLNAMLQKILDIQHPEQVQQRITENRTSSPDSLFRAIPAIIVENQKAVQGATIRLQLQDTVTLSGQHIPKGHYLFGTCRIASQRLLLDIKHIRLGTSIVPVDLSVYALDGMPGIYAPEAELSDAINQGTGNAIGGIGMIGFDQSLATQVAGAGLDAAKSLLNKKVKRIKVKLKAGYPILLRNNQLRTR